MSKDDIPFYKLTRENIKFYHLGRSIIKSAIFFPSIYVLASNFTSRLHEIKPVNHNFNFSNGLKLFFNLNKLNIALKMTAISGVGFYALHSFSQQYISMRAEKKEKDNKKESGQSCNLTKRQLGLCSLSYLINLASISLIPIMIGSLISNDYYSKFFFLSSISLSSISYIVDFNTLSEINFLDSINHNISTPIFFIFNPLNTLIFCEYKFLNSDFFNKNSDEISNQTDRKIISLENFIRGISSKIVLSLVEKEDNHQKKLMN